jgi:hypothetical protein
MNHARKQPPAAPLFPVPKPVKTPIWDQVKHHAVMASLSMAMAASAGCAIWYLTPLHTFFK